MTLARLALPFAPGCSYMGREAAKSRQSNRKGWLVSLRGAGVSAEGEDHEFGKIYGEGARVRAGRAVARLARGPSAVHAGARAESASGRRGGLGRRPYRPGGREFPRGAETGRGGAGQTAQGRGLGGWAALHAADDGAAVRQCREDRPEGGRFLRDRRAPAARGGDGEGDGSGQDPGQRGRLRADPQFGDQRPPKGPHRRYGERREPV